MCLSSDAPKNNGDNAQAQDATTPAQPDPKPAPNSPSAALEEVLSKLFASLDEIQNRIKTCLEKLTSQIGDGQPKNDGTDPSTAQ